MRSATPSASAAPTCRCSCLWFERLSPLLDSRMGKRGWGPARKSAGFAPCCAAQSPLIQSLALVEADQLQQQAAVLAGRPRVDAQTQREVEVLFRVAQNLSDRPVFGGALVDLATLRAARAGVHGELGVLGPV